MCDCDELPYGHLAFRASLQLAMAFAGVLKDAEITAALEECKGRSCKTATPLFVGSISSCTAIGFQ